MSEGRAKRKRLPKTVPLARLAPNVLKNNFSIIFRAQA